MLASLALWFQPDDRYEGVRPIHILLLRILYGLMFVVLGYTVWGHILSIRGPWEPYEAVAWCVWAGFSLMAGFGLFHPLKMIPVLLLEIVYKSLWLFLVAAPLSMTGELEDSLAEEIATSFVLVVLPILVVPWGYAFRVFVRGSQKS